MPYLKNRIHFWSDIVSRTGLLLLMGTLFVGCAVTPHPSIDVYMEPIEGRFNAHIEPETGAATVVKKGVAVTIKPLDEVELFALTEAPRLNPYLFVEKDGAVEPLYTVFEITVHNRENRRVHVDDTAMLIGGNGVQYANLTNDYFASLYDNVNLPHSTPWAAAYPYSPAAYSYYRSYVDVEALEGGRIVVEDTIFEGGKLFNGAKRSGFLIFDRLARDATDIRIVVPDVQIIRPKRKEERLEFKLDFRQVLQ